MLEGRGQSEAALSMECEGDEDERDELAVGEDPLAFLRRQPQFQQMLEVLFKFEQSSNVSINNDFFCRDVILCE